MTDQNNSEMAVLILGESHSIAVARAIERSGESEFASIDVRNKSGKIDPEVAYGDKIDYSSFAGMRPRNLVLAFGGTEHNIIGLIETEPKFDFIWPPHESIKADRTMVPSIVLEEMLGKRLKSALVRAIAVRAHFDCPVVALAPPPPFLEVDEDAVLPRAFSSLVQAGIAPASLRMKLYCVLCKAMEKAYSDHGISLIMPPAGSKDDNGFLHRSLWAKDPTHGNYRYGMLVIDHLKEQLNV